MPKAKVSIIVPVYKAERTLSRCIDSILVQTYTDFEVLLIDDGSPDKSGILCDEYARKDSRVRVFHKPNGGVSSARNLGLDNARGEWIAFVDADDYLSNIFLSLALQYDSDLVMLGYADIFPDGTIKQGGGMDDLFENQVLELLNCQCIKEFVEARYAHTGILRTVWGKLIKREIVEDLRFNQSIRFGEDTIFIFQILCKSKSLTYIHGKFYYYFYSNVLYRYNMKISEADLQVTTTYNVYNNCGFEIDGFPLQCFHERFILCIKDIFFHPLKYLRAEGFRNIAKLYSNYPTRFLTNYFFKFTFKKVGDRLITKWKKLVS